ncbi:heparan-alpha-glucosaminide N-acetyltransferase [Phascolarctobacterium sp.]|uniref:heparan-alpha-glucosaminide N-acetyltransferase n=1 Tax=Phascolarctobacterium sp. TaxID=2049039 RepID=UPI003868D494
MQEKIRQRYGLLDALRGLAIIGVVVFHFLYDVNCIYGLNEGWYDTAFATWWRVGTCWLFAALSGFVWHMGRENCLRRGLQLNLLGLAITAVTAILMPEEIIYFGILNFMGCAAWLMWAWDKWMLRLPASVGMWLGLFVYSFCNSITDEVVGWSAVNLQFAVPGWLYELKFLAPLGFPHAGFVSADYFPLLPWFGLFLFGYYLYIFAQGRQWLQQYASSDVPLLSAVGRHTLPIYLLHQPVCLGLCYLYFGH